MGLLRRRVAGSRKKNDNLYQTLSVEFCPMVLRLDLDQFDL